MELLLWLQEIRTPFLSDAALLVSMLCDKILLIAIFCYIFWCADKRFGYGLGLSFVLSGLLVQGIKISARVERPFVKNPFIKPYEKALETATGYSFPSGHTQTAASLLGFTAFNIKGFSGKVISFICILLVMLSRMVLGVHTPLDVSVSFLLTVFVSWMITRFEKAFYRHNGVLCFLGAVLSSVILFVTVYWVQIGRIPYEQAEDCIVMCVCSITFFVCWFIENKYIGFDPSFTFGKKNRVFSQIIKFALGMTVVIVVYAVFSATGSVFFEYLSYAVIFFWICCGYPMIIRRYGKGK